MASFCSKTELLIIVALPGGGGGYVGGGGGGSPVTQFSSQPPLCGTQS